MKNALVCKVFRLAPQQNEKLVKTNQIIPECNIILDTQQSLHQKIKKIFFQKRKIKIRKINKKLRSQEKCLQGFETVILEFSSKIFPTEKLNFSCLAALKTLKDFQFGRYENFSFLFLFHFSLRSASFRFAFFEKKEDIFLNSI